ncbi:MAG: hypothetical protein P8180_08765 [Gammaproteobacteria bacterium]|jgi:hypothetical protein
MKHLHHVLLTIALALGLATTGCAADTTTGATSPPARQEAKTVTVTGKIVHLSIEGGFWGIVASDGAHYDPVNLPKAFQQEGLKVQATLRTKPGMVSFHMWGTLVDVVDIQKAD